MIKIGKIISLFLFIFFSHISFAQVSVQATVDKNEMAVNDTLVLSVIVTSKENVNPQDPRITNFNGFDLLNKWSQSAVSQKLMSTPKGMEFETIRRQEYHYQIAPKIPGKFNIDSIEVVVDGKVYRTQPILVTVYDAQDPVMKNKKGRMQPPVNPPDNLDQMDEEDDIFSQLLREREKILREQLGGGGGFGGGQVAPKQRQLPINPNEAFFIQTDVDKQEVYEGEQVTVNWYVYTRGQMETFDRLKFPDLKGFWKEVIEEVPSIQFQDEIVNGIPYKKALIASHALFPIKAGVAYIDEFKIKSRVRVPVSGGLGGFFGQAYEFTKSSKKIAIKVKPLPTEGRSSSFSGAVGLFDVFSSVDSSSVIANQPFNLKIRFEGAGNAKLIELPAIDYPGGVEVYDTKSDSKFFKNGKSYKEFEVLIIPRQEGPLKLPPISVSMFDPESQKYYTKTTQPIDLNVGHNPNASAGLSNRMALAPTPQLSSNILPGLILDLNYQEAMSSKKWPYIWIFIYAAIFIFFIFQLLKIYNWRSRSKKLSEMVNERFKKIDEYVNAEKYRQVGSEMANVFYFVLGDISGEGGATEEINKLIEKAPPSIRRDFSNELLKQFEVFQTLSFAPEEALGSLKSKAVMKSKVGESKKMIEKIMAATDKV